MSRAKPPKREPARQEPPREQAEWKYTLKDCMKLGLVANLLFVAFIIICLIYYYIFARKGNYVIPFETIAYTTEALGFALFILAVVRTDKLVRARGLMNVLLPVYIAVEVILMLLEFDLFIPVCPFTYYNGLSQWLIIAHVMFSAGISLSLLQMEPGNKRLQVIVGITCGVILAGILTAASGARVYTSILINAFAYIFFFAAMHQLLRLEEVQVDCHGDRAEESSFSTTMFTDSPLLTLPPEKRRRTFGQIAKDAARQLSAEEQSVLTDENEQFQYEFGVDDADDDFEDGEDE